MQQILFKVELTFSLNLRERPSWKTVPIFEIPCWGHSSPYLADGGGND